MGQEKRKLPDGWVTIKVDELMVKTPSVNPANRPTNKYELWSVPAFPTDGPEYVQGEDVGSNKQIVQPGDVLLCKINPRINRVWLVREKTGFDQIASTEWIVLRCNELLPEFIMYLLREEGFRHRLCADLSGIGGSLTRARPRIVGKLEISLAPLNEQKRIVAKIGELQAHSRQAREALDTIPELLEQLRQSILAAAFRGDLTKEWRKNNRGSIEPATELLKRIRTERRKRWEEAELDKLKAKGLIGDKLDEAFAKRRKQYKEPRPVDTTDLPELPEGWCWTYLPSISWNSSYGTSKKCDYIGHGNPVIRIPNVLNGNIEIEDLKYSLEEINLSPKEFLATNDLLIIRTNGSRNLIGRCAVVENAFERPTYFASYLIRYRLCGGQSLPKWVGFLWESRIIRKKLESLASTSAGQYNVSLSKLDSIILPIPPEEEIDYAIKSLQSSFRWLNSIRKNGGDIGDNLTKLDHSILTKAFCGELIPQDPNDESASILLERIRMEKARQAVEKKGKPKQRGKKMKRPKVKQQDILIILQEPVRAMTPEELFAAAGFAEDSVDTFYEQLRKSVFSKQVREMRVGDSIQLEAIGK